MVALGKKSRFGLEERHRLLRAKDQAVKDLRPHREHRYERLLQALGDRYGDSPLADQANARVALPTLKLALKIYLNQLIGNCPQGLVTSDFPTLLPAATELQFTLNYLLRCKFQTIETLQAVAYDAMLLMGVSTIGLDIGGSDEDDPGTVFWEHVLFENFFVDMRAENWSQIDFCGHEFEVRREDLFDNEDYDAKARQMLEEKLPTNSSGGEERDANAQDYDSAGAGGLSNKSGGTVDTFYDRITLSQFWLPYDKKVLILASDPAIPPLKEIRWKGPETGPYDILAFQPVPGNIMPDPPIAMLESLHEIINVLFNKLVKQASRQKFNLGVSGGNEDDARRICDSADGDAVAVQNPDGCKEFSVGGFSQENFGFVTQLFQHLNRFGGNLDALGGLAPSSDTVGQDKLLANSASQMVKSMQDVMYRYTKRCLWSIAHWIWTDPLSQYHLMRPVEGTDIAIPMQWPFYQDENGVEQDRREGEFLQYNCEIEAFSMEPRSPQDRAELLLSLLERMVPALAPFMQPMGMAMNAEEVIKTLAKYLNFPELKQMILYAEGQMEQGVEQPRMPANTTRTNVRVSRSAGAEGQAQNAIIANAMFGNKNQPRQEQAVAGVGM